uniref:Chitin-binding type-2 domain-containing protein n=1 Tax=Meloidogyne incognita TaxID=6306 RepID=A0A914NHC6_MELIC
MRFSNLIPLFSLIISNLILLVSSAEPQFRNPVNCANLPDGNYVWGCSRFYSICTNGRELAMNCYHNLKLNPGTNQCEEPQSIPICADGGSAYSHQLYRAKDPFTCDGKPNGEYESSVCSSTYITCDNGKKIERECPYGLAYNQKAGACDRKEKCKTDKGAPGQGNVRRMRASSPFEDSFGGYEAPISKFAGGPPAFVPPIYAPPAYGPTPQPNPPTTTKPPPVYIPVTPAPPAYIPPQQPAPPSYVPPSPPAQPPAYAPPSYVPTPPPAYGPAPPPAYGPAPPPQFDCSSKPDGLYELPSGGCTDKFWKCANQRAFLYQCPPNLAYYAVGKYCDYKFYVPACGGSPPPVQTSTAGPPPPPTYDCSKKSDGLYGAGNCTSSYFFYCSAGKTTVMQCASPQLVFDEVNQVCEYSGECGKQKPKPPSYGQPPAPPSYQPPAPPSYAPPAPPSYAPPAPPSYAPPAPPSYQPPAPPSYGPPAPPSYGLYRKKRNIPQPPQYPPPQPILPYVPPPVSFNCSGKADGYYVKDGCSKDYYTCTNGIAYSTTCPGSLFFNIVSKQCDYKENCPPPPTPPPPPPSQYSPPAPIPPPQTPPPPPISCKGRKDGFYYQKACEGHYYVCSGESAFTQYCPAGTLFEPAKAECTFKEECGKTPPQPYTPPPSVYTPQQVPPGSPDTVKIPPSPPSSPSYGEFNCHGKADGYYYQQNCQQIWIICTGGYTYKQNCAPGTLFDSKQNGCTFAAECGKKGEGKYLTTTTTINSSNSQQQQLIYSLSNNKIKILPPPHLIYSQPQINECLNKKDGFLLNSKNCQNKYFVCSGKRKIELKCPEGLVFDFNFGKCEYLINCGRKNKKEKERSNIYPTTILPPILPQSFGTFSCKERIDGYYYKIPCSPNFYICVGGLPQKLKCPDKLVFDPINVLCQYKEVCGKTK